MPSKQKRTQREIQPLLTPEEVARFLNISLTSVYRLSHGDIRCYRIGSGLRFAQQDVLAYLKEHVTDTMEVAEAKMIAKKKGQQFSTPTEFDFLKNNPPLPKLLDVDEVATLLNVSKTTVYRIVQSHLITVYKVHGRLNFHKEEVEAYLEKEQSKPPNERFFIAPHKSHPKKTNENRV